MEISPIFILTISGVFEFEETTKTVYNNAGIVSINVVRTEGAKGTVAVTIEAVADTATLDQDYALVPKVVQFNDGEVY